MNGTSKLSAPTKRAAGAAAGAAVIALALGLLALVGCQSVVTGISQGVGDAPEVAEGTVEYWAQKYPHQFNSIQTNKTRDGVTHGHDALRSICEAPVVRVAVGSGAFEQDEGGHFLIDGFTYDPETGQYVITPMGAPAENGIYQSCIACKSSKFNVLYETDPLKAFTEGYDTAAVETVGGQYWDCATCHDGEPGQSLGSNLVYFNAMLGDRGQELTDGEKACGQCHNSFDYERMVTAGDDIYSFDPYRYGFDADSLLKAALEDGLQSVDEETGIETVMVFHPEMEFFQNSTHDSMGLDCTSCHMPQTVAEDGEAFTNHDASGSPLENPDALALCLTCHEKQGIQDADAMVAMVRGKQQEAAVLEAALDGKLASLHDATAAAVKSGTVSEAALDQAREAYTKAYYYLHYVRGMYAADGVKVAHNPVGTFDLLSRADRLVDDALAQIG